MNIKTAIVYRRNFIAWLPKDFETILAVHKHGWQYLDNSPAPDNREWCRVVYNADKNFLWLSGSYSKWWIVRKVEQLWELYKPVQYKITYYAK